MALRERFLELPAARVRVLERDGEAGRTVVFLHGITSAASTWEPHLEGLPEGVRGIAYDGLGSGYTERSGPRAPISRDDQRALMLAVADAVGSERFRIVAHSMGAGPALGVAWRYPERVGALLLESPATQGRRVLGPMLWMAMHGPTARLLEIAAPLLVPRAARARAKVLAGGRTDPELTRREAGHALERPRALIRGYVDLIGGTDLRRPSPETEHFRKIRAPIWILRGSEDLDWMPESHESLYRELLPEARVIRWVGVGHSPHIETPGRFTELLHEFLGATAQ